MESVDPMNGLGYARALPIMLRPSHGVLLNSIFLGFFTNEFWTRAKVTWIGKMTTNKLDLPWQEYVAEEAEDFSRMR